MMQFKKMNSLVFLLCLLNKEMASILLAFAAGSSSGLMQQSSSLLLNNVFDSSSRIVGNVILGGGGGAPSITSPALSLLYQNECERDTADLAFAEKWTGLREEIWTVIREQGSVDGFAKDAYRTVSFVLRMQEIVDIMNSNVQSARVHFSDSSKSETTKLIDRFEILKTQFEGALVAFKNPSPDRDWVDSVRTMWGILDRQEAVSPGQSSEIMRCYTEISHAHCLCRIDRATQVEENSSLPRRDSDPPAEDGSGRVRIDLEWERASARLRNIHGEMQQATTLPL